MGEAIRLLGISSDITERKQATERIHQQARLIEQATDAIFVCDLEARVTFWNSGAAHLYGFTAEEILGQSIMATISREPDDQREASMHAVRSTGEWHGEIRHKTKDGRALTVLSRLTLLNDETGNATGLLAVNHDLTAQKELEQQLLRTQRQETLGTLAGGVAHDLNNALAPILMGVDLLKMKYPGAPGIIDLFDTSARRAAGMVRQLLTFAKGTAGERGPVPAIHLLREMQGLIQATFPKNITLSVDCEADLPPMVGDVTQLHQVLLNLCVNARDAMPQGGTLTLAAKRVEIDVVRAGLPPNARTGHYVALSVRDTGIGMPPEIRDRIFDPFFTTKAPDKGTGLGLATVMGIVKSHHGILAVDSEPGQGTTFTVSLPADETAGTARPETSVELPLDGRGKTILFVDDEPTVREIVRAVLLRLNFRVALAQDGTDALMWVTQHRATLHAVITDLHMPNHDGLTFVNALQRLASGMPVLVFSGRLEDDMKAQFRTLGVTLFLDKPCTEDQLVGALRVLTRQQQERLETHGVDEMTAPTPQVAIH